MSIAVSRMDTISYADFWPKPFAKSIQTKHGALVFFPGEKVIHRFVKNSCGLLLTGWFAIYKIAIALE